MRYFLSPSLFFSTLVLVGFTVHSAISLPSIAATPIAQLEDEDGVLDEGEAAGDEAEAELEDAGLVEEADEADEAEETESVETVEEVEIGQTYVDPNGQFQIALPTGYTYQPTGSGITFSAPDGTFIGSVDIGPAQGQRFSPQQLEDKLKREYQARLLQVTWQGSALQPDGSLRIDWLGLDPLGNNLDAISFVEQRGDRIFILNLFGVNASYSNHNADAEAIINTYRLPQ